MKNLKSIFVTITFIAGVIMIAVLAYQVFFVAPVGFNL